MSQIQDMGYKLGISLFKSYFKFEYDIHGEILSEGTIIVANHTSRLDGPILAAGLERKLVFLSRLKPWSWPWIPFQIGQIHLNKYGVRGCLEKARKKIEEEGYQFAIFPEGKYNSKNIGQFNNGIYFFASQLKLSVTPISIRGTTYIWPQGQKHPSRKGKIILNVGIPLDSNQYKKEDFINTLRNRVTELYNQYVFKQ